MLSGEESWSLFCILLCPKISQLLVHKQWSKGPYTVANTYTVNINTKAVYPCSDMRGWRIACENFNLSVLWQRTTHTCCAEGRPTCDYWTLILHPLYIRYWIFPETYLFLRSFRSGIEGALLMQLIFYHPDICYLTLFIQYITKITCSPELIKSILLATLKDIGSARPFRDIHQFSYQYISSGIKKN